MTDLDISRLKIEKTAATGTPKRRLKRFIWVLLAVALAASLFLSGALSPRVEIKTATASLVYPSQTFTKLNASGYVVAQRKAAVAAKATGRLVWLGVEEGSVVKKGQVIARLEKEDVLAAEAQADANLKNARWLLEQASDNIANSRSALEQAEAELQDSKLNIERMKDLLARGVVAKADYDASEARYKKAVAAVSGAKSALSASEAAKNGAESAVHASEAALKGARVSVEYTLIRAPFDAVVLTKNADVGDIVTPIGAAANAKAAVVTIADMGSLQVEADVSESNLGQVKAGQPCEIQLDALPDIRFRGEVSTIVPTADRSKASVMVKIRFVDTDTRILPEMSAKVAFLEREAGLDEKAPRLAVNPAAVVQSDGRQAVFVVRQDRVYTAPVTIGEKLGDWVVVTGGLKAGDKVALSPLEKLRDGARIKEAEQ